MLITLTFDEAGLGDLAGAQRYVVVRHGPDRMIASSFDADVDVFTGKERAQLLLQRA